MSVFGTFARMPRWSGRRARVLIAAPVTAALLLAGCTGGTPTATESTTTPPVETPTPTPTPTPSETPEVDVTVKPERPAALDEPPSVEGAVAVAEYFLMLFPYVFATGDLVEWAALSHPDCLYCTGVTEDVRAMVAAGRHGEGGRFTIAESSGSDVDPGSWYSATVSLSQEPSTTVDAQGVVVEAFPEFKTGVIDLAVIWNAGAWSIREATPSAETSS